MKNRIGAKFKGDHYILFAILEQEQRAIHTNSRHIKSVMDQIANIPWYPHP